MGKGKLLYNSIEDVKDELYDLRDRCDDFLERNKDNDELFIGLLIVSTRRKFIENALKAIKFIRRKDYDKADKYCELAKKHYLVHKFQLKKLGSKKKDRDYYTGMWKGLKLYRVLSNTNGWN